MGFEQDYILRLTRQLALAIARMMGVARRSPDEALQVAEAAYGDLFGLPPGLIDRASAETLRQLLGSVEKCRALADLLEAEAGLLDPERAARRRELASRLRDEKSQD